MFALGVVREPLSVMIEVGLCILGGNQQLFQRVEPEPFSYAVPACLGNPAPGGPLVKNLGSLSK